MNPKMINGSCILGRLRAIESTRVAGDYSKFKTSEDPSNIISNNIYYQYNNSTMSYNLKRIPQASGGIMPKVNKNIGAPLCTFVYGFLGNDNTPSPYFNLIKGPLKTNSFGFTQVDYDPQFSAVRNIVSTEGVITTQSEPPTISFRRNVLDSFPTIPSKITSKYPNATKPMRTWNIWKPYYQFKKTTYIQNSDPQYAQPSNYTTVEKQLESLYGKPLQGIDNTMDGAYIYCPSLNSSTYLQRLFPIACDMVYRYENGENDINNQDPYLFYPPVDSDVSTISKPIQCKPSENCGFQMHFVVTETSKIDLSSDVLDADGISIIWGSDADVTYPGNEVIDLFQLKLIPGERPKLFFWNPLRKIYENYPLSNTPVFCYNGSTKFSVYVHYVGSLMMVGFNQNNDDNIQWSIFNPINLSDTYNAYFYPVIPKDAVIGLLLNNINVAFQYGPIAFLNYDPYPALATEDFATTNRFNCQILTNWRMSTDNITDEIAMNEQFHNGRIAKYSDSKELDKDDIIKYSSTYYGDWRRIIHIDTNDPSKNIGYEINWQRRTNSSAVLNGIDLNPDEEMIQGHIIFDTTIEGPLYFSINSIFKPLEEKPDILENFLEGDISDFMTEFNVEYFPVADDYYHNYISGKATVILKNLALTRRGRTILTLLHENRTGITLGAGEDDPKPCFQGVIKKFDTVFDESSSTTTIELVDILTHILTKNKFQDYFKYMGMNIIFALKHALEQANLSRWFVNQTELDSNGQADDFYTIYSKYKLGFALNASLNIDDMDAPPYKPVFPIVNMLMKHFTRKVDKTGVLWWNPQEKVAKLEWRQNPRNINKLQFLGTYDNNSNVQLPQNIDGVLIDSYKISADVDNLHAGLILVGSSLTGPLSFHPDLFENAISKDASDRLENQITFPDQLEDEALGYIGHRDEAFLDVSELQIRTQAELEEYGQILIDNYLKKTYSTIDFSCYIMNPLNPFAMFSIETFIQPDDTADKITSINIYQYERVTYNFIKAKNIFKATIRGEKVPPIGLIKGKV